MFNDTKTRGDRMLEPESYFKTHFVDIALILLFGAFVAGIIRGLIF